MAELAASNQNTILKIREFLGLNENPDGDTHIKNGELSQCRNFRITRDKHLQLRPGQKTTADLKTAWDALPSKPVTAPEFSGAWSGFLDGQRHTVASFGGVLWDLSPEGGTPVKKGTCTQAPASFFGFGNKVYLLNGHEYMSWDGKAGSSFQTVEGYIPTVRTASAPQGGGTLLENVNRLTGKRKVKFSPDGSSTSFFLEKDIDEVVSVEGTSLSYTVNKSDGTVTFSSAPPQGVHTLRRVTYGFYKCQDREENPIGYGLHLQSHRLSDVEAPAGGETGRGFPLGPSLQRRQLPRKGRQEGQAGRFHGHSSQGPGPAVGKSAPSGPGGPGYGRHSPAE